MIGNTYVSCDVRACGACMLSSISRYVISLVSQSRCMHIHGLLGICMFFNLFMKVIICMHVHEYLLLCFEKNINERWWYLLNDHPYFVSYIGISSIACKGRERTGRQHQLWPCSIYVLYGYFLFCVIFLGVIVNKCLDIEYSDNKEDRHGISTYKKTQSLPNKKLYNARVL
jgi:hypothetical protein